MCKMFKKEIQHVSKIKYFIYIFYFYLLYEHFTKQNYVQALVFILQLSLLYPTVTDIDILRYEHI